MMNPFTEVNWQPHRAAKKKFAMSLMIGFPCIAALMLLAGRISHGHWPPGPVWLAGVGFAIGLVLWLLPGIALPFYQAWYFFGCCLGFVLGNVLLSLFFYLVITPVGLVLRLAGRRSLTKGFDKNSDSYWQKPKKVVDLSDYYRQF